MDKKEIRIAVRRALGALSGEERARASERIFAAVERLPEFAAAHTVGVFVSLADEPQTAAFMERWRGEKRVVVPRVEGYIMNFYDYDPAKLAAGAFGIFEPSADAAACCPGDVDLLVVPGVAFTTAGERLGRGRGFYDRYMSSDGFRAFTVGVCFGCQLLDRLPVEPHDLMVDTVVSDI